MLKFVDKWFIGYQAPRKDGIRLGFMTPDGTDSAAKKRKETVTKWCRTHIIEDGKYVMDKNNPQRYAYNEGENEVLEGTSFEGFKIKHSISRGGSYYGSQDKWRIEDPRGFELEITSKNIEVILAYTSIEHGTIVGKCRWGREGANNVLVPENAPEYQEATANTKKLATATITLTDADIGKKVTCQRNDNSGIYLGKWNLSKHNNYLLKFDVNYHLILNDSGLVHAIKDPKAIEVSDDVVSGARCNYEDVKTYLAELVEEGKKPKYYSWRPNEPYYSGFYVYGHKDMYNSWVPHFEEFTVDKEEIPYDQIRERMEKINGDGKTYGRTDQNKFILGYTDRDAKVPARYVTLYNQKLSTQPADGTHEYHYGWNQSAPLPLQSLIYVEVKSIS